MTNPNFEQLKEEALKAAREVGIVDVFTASTEPLTLDTINLATQLMKEHGDDIYTGLMKEWRW